MSDKPKYRLDWKIPLKTAFAASVTFLILVIVSIDLGLLFYLLLILPVASLMLLGISGACKSQRPSWLLALLTLWFASWVLMTHTQIVRDNGRWLLWSPSYKAKVLEQPLPSNGMLRHVKWDAWGFVPAGNTTVYLVYDPTNSLEKAAESNVPGQYIGVPCTVPLVRRFESNWYSVLFYTDMDWDHCKLDGAS